MMLSITADSELTPDSTQLRNLIVSNPDKSFLNGRVRSFRNAVRGVYQLFRHEPNAQIHFVAACFVLTLAVFLNVSKTDFALLTVAVTMVIVTEAVNTAIERLTDRVSPEFHPLAGQAKDVAAGAVLLSSFGATAIGVIVFVL
jgi:diacylglycerol kinase